MNYHDLGAKLYSLWMSGDVKRLVLATPEELNGFSPQANDCHRRPC
jgi:hypothetical protein